MLVLSIEMDFPAINMGVPALLDRISEVCPLPAAAQRVLSLTSQAEPDAKEIVDALGCEPAMAAEVLRIANSAAYSRSRRVTDLHQSVMMIGFRSLRDMAAAMSLLAAFASDREISGELHKSSALSGMIARLVANEFLPKCKGLSLICGLLCELGALACLAVDGDAYTDLIQTAREGTAIWSMIASDRRDTLEMRRYGATTREIGARLLERNDLPEDIVKAIAAPAASGEEPTPLGRLTMFSRRAAPLLVNTLETVEPATIEAMLYQVAEEAGLGIQDRQELCRVCLDAVRETQTSLRKI